MGDHDLPGSPGGEAPRRLAPLGRAGDHLRLQRVGLEEADEGQQAGLGGPVLPGESAFPAGAQHALQVQGHAPPPGQGLDQLVGDLAAEKPGEQAYRRLHRREILEPEGLPLGEQGDRAPIQVGGFKHVADRGRSRAWMGHYLHALGPQRLQEPQVAGRQAGDRQHGGPGAAGREGSEKRSPAREPALPPAVDQLVVSHVSHDEKVVALFHAYLARIRLSTAARSRRKGPSDSILRLVTAAAQTVAGAGSASRRRQA